MSYNDWKLIAATSRILKLEALLREALEMLEGMEWTRPSGLDEHEARIATIRAGIGDDQ